MNNLDDRTVRERLDLEGSFERNRDLPEQCLEAWRSISNFKLPPSFGSPDSLLVAGMGGSAVSGDLLQGLTSGSSGRPCFVSRGYSLPAWVNSRTLVIACSHSGNTSETLAAFEDAGRRGAQLVVVTTGGRLGEMASTNGVPTLGYHYAAEPRSALGHTFLRLLAVARAAGFYRVSDQDVSRAIKALETLRSEIDEGIPETSNTAKQVARRLYGRLPFVVAGEYLAPTAKRWRTQINENAKAWAIADELPEMHHNTVVGLQLAKQVSSLVHAVILEHQAMGEPILTRARLTSGLLASSRISHERLEVGGDDSLQAVLRSVYYANFVSFYLAMLNDVSPWEVEAIDRVKKDLGAL